MEVRYVELVIANLWRADKLFPLNALTLVLISCNCSRATKVLPVKFFKGVCSMSISIRRLETTTRSVVAVLMSYKESKEEVIATTLVRLTLLTRDNEVMLLPSVCTLVNLGKLVRFNSINPLLMSVSS